MLQEYTTENIRNVCIIGHDGTGKSTLLEAMLFVTGKINSMGSSESGNLVSDFDDEEKKRQMSISNALACIEHDGVKINVIDTPGKAGFVGDQRAALQVADLAVLVVDAVDGVQIETEKAWRYLKENNVPRVIFVNKMDRERASYEKVIDNLKNSLKVNVATLCLPVEEGPAFSAVIDIIDMKMMKPKGDGNKVDSLDVPTEFADAAEEAKMNLVEQAAEGDDELIEKFLEGEELTDEEMRRGINEQLVEGRLSSVICGSATKKIGIWNLIKVISRYAPSPGIHSEYTGHKKDNPEESVTVAAKDDSPFSAVVWKTYIDQFSGRFSYIKIISGTLGPDSEVLNPVRDQKERISKVYSMMGGKMLEVPKLHSGDLGVVLKLENTVTMDTLCDPKNPVVLPLIEMPHPVYSLAVEAVNKSDEDKLSQFFHRVTDENPTITYAFNPETKETVLSGMGDLQLGIILDALREKSKIEVETREPRVAYRETITKKAESQYKHKKQSGGHGQYGEVYFRVWPQQRGEGFEFKDSIVGGVVPKQYIPGVQKGVQEGLQEGVLGKYPVVDVGVEIYDGSYHSVDSSEMAFKIASRNCLKKAMEAAGPQLLEPVMKVRIFVDKEFMGDILNDVTSRRGRVLGMDNAEDSGSSISVVNAQIPLAEMLRYSIDLKSMTSGKATFETEFSHYDPVTGKVAEKVIEARKKLLEEDNE
jgi:elongation factor G